EASARRDSSLERVIAPTEAATEPWAIRDGTRMLNLSSNSYLGIADNPTLREAAVRGAERAAGAGASRLVTGSDSRYRATEERVADMKGTEGALLLGSGYLANVGTLACLLDRNCGVVSDTLNHASIIDGVRLSRAHVYRYNHADLDELETRLREASIAGHARVLVVTDSVFSMDGDTAPLAEIVGLKNQFGAALVVDDAHGTGVFGTRGAGYVDQLGLTSEVDIQIGTFSKAFGAYGAYVAADASWIKQLVNTSRTLTFSTGLPPALIETIDAALTIVAQADEARASLARKATAFRSTLTSAGLDTGESSTQIVPLIAGPSDIALRLAERLRVQGLLAQAIRPPTVPAGSARIRFSLMATHSDEALAEAARTIAAEAKDAGLART
ncbi:MAG: aminotransferase class I/II-fold pyridoxal phosphate-dependent enzyme, partial [Gaiellaceae bacterium]